MAVAAVSVKLPEFWEEDPATWFIEAESQFVLAGIVVDATKYHHIVKHITTRSTINAVWDIISNPPEHNKYDTLKSRLLHVFSDSHQIRIEKLMSAQLGDMKPSQFLVHLRRLAHGSGINDETLKAIFMKGLPARISSVLILSNNPLTECAYFGDQMMMKLEPEVNEINRPDDKYNELKQEIEFLTAAVRNLGQNRPSRAFDRKNFSRNPRGNQSRNSNVCWYHMKYGNNAHRCLSPCQFQKN